MTAITTPESLAVAAAINGAKPEPPRWWITAIKLTRYETDVVVLIEVDGRWVEVIRERAEAPISHIVEESGIAKAIQAGR